MKLLDILYEEMSDDERERKRKKINIMYDSFKHGTMNVDNHGQRPDAIFEYILSDEKSILFKYDSVIIFPKSIKIIEKNEVASQTNKHLVIKGLKKKFNHFNLEIDFNRVEYDIEGWKEPTEDLNEDVEIDVPKEKQRVKTIFNALKSGVLFVPFMGEKFKYVLNNDYQLSIGIGKDHNDTILFVISDDKNPKLKIYSIKTDKEMPKFVHVDSNVYLPMYEGVFKMVAKKFSHFNIHLR